VTSLVGAFFTAFYMFRLYFLAFRKESHLTHKAEHHLHESPRTMIIPLVVLAILTVVGGWVGLPFQKGGHAFERWLRPVFEPDAVGTALGESVPHAAVHPVSPMMEWILLELSVGVALAGIVFAFRAYLRDPGLATRLRTRLAPMYRVLAGKYFVDELYDRLVVTPVYATSERLWRFWDVKVVDGAVNGVGLLLEGASAALRLLQTGFVGTYALFIALGAAALVLHFLRH